MKARCSLSGEGLIKKRESSEGRIDPSLYSLLFRKDTVEAELLLWRLGRGIGVIVGV